MNREQLRNSTRTMADQPGDYPTDDQVNDIIDRAAGAVWRRLLVAGWTPDRTTVSITADGSTSYTLGTDVSVVHLVHSVSSDGRTPLRRVKPEALHDALSTLNASDLATSYALVGGALGPLQVELYPTPTSGSYEVRYTKRFPGFTTDSAQWYGPDGSDELIILTSAFDSAMVEDPTSPLVQALLKKLEIRWPEVIDGAGFLDSQGQQIVRDARAPGSGLLGDYRASEGYEWL